MEKITGIILAGGKSSRMGVDKAFLPFFDKKIIEHNLLLLKATCNEVFISANNSEYDVFNVPVVKDVHRETGPIGGLHACLKKSANEYNLFLTCDMPFVNQGLLYGLLMHLNKGYDIIAYKYKDRVEPLIACYSKKILPVVEKKISDNNYKMQSLFERGNIKLIPLTHETMLANINSKTDILHFQNYFKWKFPNMIIIAGDGRNIGKTHFACSIIKHLSKIQQVIAIKTSAHFHDSYSDSQLLKETETFKIVVEKNITGKDSSLMLQAGAAKVFFIMAKNQGLSDALEFLKDEIKNKIVVAESGGLSEIILPGLFFFIKQKDKPIEKDNYLKYQPIIVENDSKSFDFNIEALDYREHYIVVKNFY